MHEDTNRSTGLILSFPALMTLNQQVAVFLSGQYHDFESSPVNLCQLSLIASSRAAVLEIVDMTLMMSSCVMVNACLG
jgi:hypothetical protein